MHTENRINTSAMENLDIIEENLQLSEQQQAELDALFSDIGSRFNTGSIIKGSVVSKDSDGVIVDVNYKSNGFVSSKEFSEKEFKTLATGNEIEVALEHLEDKDGNVVLSYQKAKSIKAWERIASLAETDEPVRGIVLHKVKGGLNVDIGVPAFLPGSQVDTQRVADFDQFVNQEVICKILKINKKRGNVIISRRKYLEEQRAEDRKSALDTLQEGQVIEGIVKNITNYGVFVDIGGIDGLLHITDMSWGRIAHPSELVKIGDRISVKVLSFDKEREKVSLGMKQLLENPWNTIDDQYTIGSKVKGRVSSITDYGMFVEIEKGIEGLVHVSEISWTERITNIGKYYSVGDVVDAVIVGIDKDSRRMSLSIRQLQEDPWKGVVEKIKVGDKIQGKVSNITDFGIFVQIDESIDGLVHVSDLSWTEHISHPGEKYKKGDKVEALVLSIDPAQRKISLGIKQLAGDPWEKIEEEYPVGKVIEGTVSKITNFGAFVKLPNGVEGLLHISELGRDADKIESILKVGEKQEFKVIKINKEEKRLGLSLKNSSREVTARPESKRQQQRKETKAANPLQQALADHASRMMDSPRTSEPAQHDQEDADEDKE